MHDIFIRILTMFVLSFVAMLVLGGLELGSRKRKVQRHPLAVDESEVVQVVQKPEPFRWYHVFFIILGVLFALWLLSIIAGAALAVGVMVVGYQYLRFRRVLARCLRKCGMRLPGVGSYVLAPWVASSRLFRYARGRR